MLEIALNIDVGFIFGMENRLLTLSYFYRLVMQIFLHQILTSMYLLDPPLFKLLTSSTNALHCPACHVPRHH